MATITISGNDYFSYATVEQANTFLLVQPDSQNWFLLDNDGKGKNLVAATNFLNGLPWRDECSPQSVREGKQSIIDATIYLANSIANGNFGFLGGSVQEAATKRLKAGSAEIEYFANISSFGVNPNNLLSGLPPYVRGLIIGCIAGVNTSGIGGSLSYGTCYPSTAKEPWDFSK